MTRPINFRPILFCAWSLLVGVLLFSYYPTLKLWTAFIPIILTVAIVIIFFILGEKDKRFMVLITAVFCLLFAFIGMVSFGVYIDNITKSQVESGVYTVKGEVGKVSYKEGRYIFTLTNCLYDGNEGGDLYVNTITEEIDLYDIVELKCYAYPYSIIYEGKVSNAILSGREMAVDTVFSYDIIGKSDSIASKFKTETDRLFFDVLGENGGILSALIRGDTSEMKESIDPFRLVGIAHIFAVSGMHIGLLFAAISFVMKRIPIARWLKTAITCFALFVYSYLCGFAISSLRAAIMCSCIEISGRLGQKYDALNSLSEAFIIIVLLFPIEMFSAGFILSFTVSLSLIILSPPIKRFFNFLPQPFAESLGVLIAAQLSAIPLSVTYFGYFSLISFLANFILLPVVTIIFYLTVIGVILCLILPINQLIALFIPKILVLGSQGVSNILSYALIPIVYFPRYLKAVYYTLLIGTSDFINLPKKIKVVCLTGVLSILLVLVLVSNLA